MRNYLTVMISLCISKLLGGTSQNEVMGVENADDHAF